MYLIYKNTPYCAFTHPKTLHLVGKLFLGLQESHAGVASVN